MPGNSREMESARWASAENGIFLISVGLLSPPHKMENIPGHLKTISDHLSCQIKLGKAMQGKPGNTGVPR